MNSSLKNSNVTIVIICCALFGFALSLYLLKKDIQPFSNVETHYQFSQEIDDSLSFNLNSASQAGLPSPVSTKTVKLEIEFDYPSVDTVVFSRILSKTAREVTSDTNGAFKIDSTTRMIKHVSNPLSTPPEEFKIAKSRFTFLETPIFLVWIAMFSVMIGTAAGMLFPVIHKIVSIIKTYGKVTYAPALAILLFCLVVAFIFFNISGGDDFVLTAKMIMNSLKVFLKSTTAMERMIKFTMISGVLSLGGILILNYCIPSLNGKIGQAFVDSYNELFSSLRFFLTSCSILVLFSVVVTSLLQQAIQRKIHLSGPFTEKISIFPSEFIYLYSLMFTIFLVAAYLPIEYHLKSVKTSRIQELVETKEITKKQKDQLANLDGPFKNLELIFSLLSPVIGNIFVDTLSNFTI